MNQSFAPYINRVGALIIDGLIVGIPLGIIGAALGLFGDVTGIIIYYALAIVATIAYYAITMSREGERNGQTIGKQILEIRVVHESGTPMTAGRAILRDVVGKYLLGFLTCYIYSLLDYLWPLWDGRKQALHDKIGSSFVLRADASPAAGGQLGGGPQEQSYGGPMSSPEQPATPSQPGGAPPPQPPPPGQ